MASINLLDTGLVYRNPYPHVVSRHAYFPTVARGADRSITCAFDVGQAFEAIDVRSYAAHSTDEGKTWSAPGQLFEVDTRDHPVSTSCRIANLNGRLVGLAALMHRSEPEIGLANPQTGGFVPTDFATIESIDSGASWSTPKLVPLPTPWRQHEICSPIVRLANGRWLLPTAPWPDWSGTSPTGPKSIVYISDDEGHSWTHAADTMNRSTEKIAFYEHKVIQLSDGRVVAVCWVVDLKTGKNLANHFSISSDNGETFGPPIAMPLLGETCAPIALPDNHVACVFRRADKRGLWAHLGRVDGDQWMPLALEPLWGTDVASSDVSKSTLLAQMSTLRFGFPNVITLNDEELLAVFWCVEDAVSNIRWLRLHCGR